jgi:hypothetical protein
MKFLAEPLLKKPAPGWSHDLPGPCAPAATEPYPRAMPNPPNHVDNIYLELARSTIRTRGVAAWGGILIALMLLFYILMSAHYLASTKNIKMLSLFSFVMIIIISIFLYLIILFWRLDTAPPRDEPIRFNRARRKVYVYRFHYAALRPFSRKAWFTRAEVYDWADLRAEACSIYGPMGSGGLIETVSLAVVKPGTNEVLDRFHFAHGGLQGEMYWALAQIYMQQGPEALPKFDRPPRDWNNEKITFNLARYLAPKVKWPEAIDIESRTAPEQTPDAT